MRRSALPRLALAALLLGGLGSLAWASKTRLRLERVNPSDFASDGTLRVYASLVELEGTIDDDKAAPEFNLLVDGQPAGKPVKMTRFSAAKDPLDLVLLVESSALYGPPTVQAPPPPPPPVKTTKHGAHDRHHPPAPPPAVTPPPPPAPTSDEQPLDQVKDAMHQLLDALSPKWRVLVIDYGGDVTPHPPFRPASGAESAIDDLSPDDESGDLHLVDAVHAALIELNRPQPGVTAPARKLIVVVSDGLNSVMERKTFRALGEAAAKARVPIHSIAFSPTDDRGPLLNLGELSKLSNGTFRWAKSADDLRAQIETLADELNKQYVLTFDVGVHSLDGRKLALRCDDLVSNTIVFDPARFAGVKTSRDLPWWAWLLAGLGVLAVIFGLFARRPKKRFSTTAAPTPNRANKPARAPKPARAKPQPQAAPTPQAPVRGVLIVVSGARAGTRVEVAGPSVTVGKGPSTLQIEDDPTVSTRHAMIAADRAGFVVTDLGSTNGTWVNNQRITQPTRLSDGDLVRFGNTQIKFRTE